MKDIKISEKTKEILKSLEHKTYSQMKEYWDKRQSVYAREEKLSKSKPKSGQLTDHNVEKKVGHKDIT